VAWRGENGVAKWRQRRNSGVGDSDAKWTTGVAKYMAWLVAGGVLSGKVV